MGQSTIDFSKLSDADLAEGRRSINPGKYPDNFAALEAEIEKRKAAGTWNPQRFEVNSSGSTTLPPIPGDARELRFEYHGTGREYFPIWITGFFLSLVTFGLYTPWAKVRARRYFFSRLKVAGASFSYRARPAQILVGRLILFGLIAAMFINSVLGAVGWRGLFAAGAVAAVIAPWVLWNSARFNFQNTSYRGISFSTDAALGHFYAFALARLFFLALSLGISLAFLGYQYRIFLVKHLRYGEMPLKYVGTFRGFAGKLLPVMLGFFFCTIIIGIVLYMSGLTGGDAWAMRALNWLSLLAFWGVADAVASSYIADNLQSGDVRFKANFDKGQLGQLYAVAAIKTACSLGLAWPWARTEILRYKAERLSLHVSGEGENAFARSPTAQTARGGFATEFFEFDLGI